MNATSMMTSLTLLTYRRLYEPLKTTYGLLKASYRICWLTHTAMDATGMLITTTRMILNTGMTTTGTTTTGMTTTGMMTTASMMTLGPITTALAV